MLLYADNVCLMTSSKEDTKLIMQEVNARVIKYGLKVNEKSKMM